MVLFRIPASARFTTVSQAPIRTFRGITSRTRSSRSSPGAWLRPGSWCRVFTTSSGPAPKRRRRSSRCVATQLVDASVPAVNLGHLMHTASANTVWDVRVGWFRFTQDISPASGDPSIANRIDQPGHFLERRPPANRRGAASSHDGQGDAQPPSGRVARRGSRVENRRGSRPGRASRGVRPSHRCELCLHEWSLDAALAAGQPLPIREAGSSRPLRS